MPDKIEIPPIEISKPTLTEVPAPKQEDKKKKEA
jgi:hypothetical protein